MKYFLLLLVALVAFTGCEYRPIGEPSVVVVNEHCHHEHEWQDHGRHVVVFSIHNCKQCEADKPTVAKIAKAGVDVVHIDGDSEEGQKLCEEYEVTKFPTYIVLEDGQVKAKSLSIAAIITILRALLWIASLFF